MKIAYLPADHTGVGHYRCIYPMQYLNEIGVECVPYAEIEQREDEGRKVFVMDTDNPPEADLYAIQATHELGRLEHIRKLRDDGKKVVVDVDDDWLAIPMSNPAWWNTHPDPVRKGRKLLKPQVPMDVWRGFVNDTFQVNRNNLLAMLVEADALTVTTEALKTRYTRFNKRIHVVPNALHWPDWEPTVWARKWVGTFRIGYMGNLTSSADNMQVLKGSLGHWMARHPDTRFVAVGDERVHEAIGIPEAQRVTALPKTIDFPGHADYVGFMDVGLVPLAETTFAECKSHLKGMEYNAAGVPYIATPTRPYRDFTKPSANGLLAKRASDWLKHIERLYHDRDKAKEMGTWGRQYVQGAHTMSRSVHRWRAAYEEVLR